MGKANYKELLDAGVHFGHLKRKWNPKMAPYIFMESNGIHIIDLNKTFAKIEESASALKQIAKSGKKILFVATKKQAKDIVSKLVLETGMPFVTERWPGGMLTNFHTIRKAVKKMEAIDKMTTDGTFENISKKEQLTIKRNREKLQRDLGSIADLTRLPAALFIVDIMKEHIAVAEARRLNIPTFGIVDTNSNPQLVDFPIPANDDSSKSIALIVGRITAAVLEGLEERKTEWKEEEKDEEGKAKETPVIAKRKRRSKVNAAKGKPFKFDPAAKKSNPGQKKTNPAKTKDASGDKTESQKQTGNENAGAESKSKAPSTSKAAEVESQ